MTKGELYNEIIKAFSKCDSHSKNILFMVDPIYECIREIQYEDPIVAYTNDFIPIRSSELYRTSW